MLKKIRCRNFENEHVDATVHDTVVMDGSTRYLCSDEEGCLFDIGVTDIVKVYPDEDDYNKMFSDAFKEYIPALKETVNRYISQMNSRRPYIGIGTYVVILTTLYNHVVHPDDANDVGFKVLPILVRIDDFDSAAGHGYIGYKLGEDNISYHFDDVDIINVIDYVQAERE